VRPESIQPYADDGSEGWFIEARAALLRHDQLAARVATARAVRSCRQIRRALASGKFRPGSSNGDLRRYLRAMDELTECACDLRRTVKDSISQGRPMQLRLRMAIDKCAATAAWVCVDAQARGASPSIQRAMGGALDNVHDALIWSMCLHDHRQ
jgi:hypothetical protein